MLARSYDRSSEQSAQNCTSTTKTAVVLGRRNEKPRPTGSWWPGLSQISERKCRLLKSRCSTMPSAIPSLPIYGRISARLSAIIAADHDPSRAIRRGTLWSGILNF
jgi:hypothetical protein